VRVNVSLKPDTPEVKRKVESLLLARLRVRPEVCVQSEAAIRRQVYVPQSRKPVRVFDHRKAAAADVPQTEGEG